MNPENRKQAEKDSQTSRQNTDPSGMSLSMHNGIDASCDCCSCEAEPYWVEAFEDQDDAEISKSG